MKKLQHTNKIRAFISPSCDCAPARQKAQLHHDALLLQEARMTLPPSPLYFSQIFVGAIANLPECDVHSEFSVGRSRALIQRQSHDRYTC